MPSNGFPAGSTRQQGDAAEAVALRFLQGKGLRLVSTNYAVRGGHAGEIDLIMRDGETLVFVEVRQRKTQRFGGAAGSVTVTKQRRIVQAARAYLMRLNPIPPCRFDVVAIEGRGTDARIEWLKAAFDAG